MYEGRGIVRFFSLLFLTHGLKKRKKKQSKSYNKPYLIVQEFMKRVSRNKIKIIFVTFIRSTDNRA